MAMNSRRHSPSGKVSSSAGCRLTLRPSLMAGLGQVIGGCDADDALPKYQGFNDTHDSAAGSIAAKLFDTTISMPQFEQGSSHCLIASPQDRDISSMWLRSTISGGDIRRHRRLCRQIKSAVEAIGPSHHSRARPARLWGGARRRPSGLRCGCRHVGKNPEMMRASAVVGKRGSARQASHGL